MNQPPFDDSEPSTNNDYTLIENDGVFREFPPIGQALVGPAAKYERDENGVVQFSVLPFDPTRTWRIVKSSPQRGSR